MRKSFCLLIILLNAWATTVKAQAPDLSKIKNDKDKIKAWINYCSELRLNKNGAKNNYVVLQQAGLKGLQLVKTGDAEDRASFFLYTALGYYYQIKFDSAQYFFYQSLHSAQLAKSTKLDCGSCGSTHEYKFPITATGKS